ncbi:MAG: hypothetical protein GX872_10540 [Firmicutes bacterium]|nr:hypothetical protein [Bacillota bacterium]
MDSITGRIELHVRKRVCLAIAECVVAQPRCAGANCLGPGSDLRDSWYNDVISIEIEFA